MPTLTTQPSAINFSRKLGFPDTNVLVAYHDDKDNYHAEAQYIIDELETDRTWLLVVPVVVEACGLLMSRRKSSLPVLNLLSWILTPGSGVILIPEMIFPLEDSIRKNHNWMQKFGIDFVDAYIMQAADYLTRTFDLRPAAQVFSFDTRDFTRCLKKGYEFTLYDMKSI